MQTLAKNIVWRGVNAAVVAPFFETGLINMSHQQQIDCRGGEDQATLSIASAAVAHMLPAVQLLKPSATAGCLLGEASTWQSELMARHPELAKSSGLFVNHHAEQHDLALGWWARLPNKPMNAFLAEIKAQLTDGGLLSLGTLSQVACLDASGAPEATYQAIDIQALAAHLQEAGLAEPVVVAEQWQCEFADVTAATHWLQLQVGAEASVSTHQLSLTALFAVAWMDASAAEAQAQTFSVEHMREVIKQSYTKT